MRKSVILLLVFVVLSHCTAVEEITDEYLEEIKSSKKIWLVYGTTGTFSYMQIFQTLIPKFFMMLVKY